MRTIEEIEKELAHWRGFTSTIDRKGRGPHHRLILTVGGRSRFVVYSHTRQGPRDQRNAVAIVRRTLKDLGAQRD